MPRYKLTIEYDGTDYSGWQVQNNGPSIQAELMKAVKAFSGEDVKVLGSGRTDAGVHALGQVAHVDLAREQPTDRIRDALNQHLKPNPISLLKVEQVDDQFDARFSAKKRTYFYRIINRQSPLALMRDRSWLVPRHLDIDIMNEGANILQGHHDFTTFRSSRCQSKSPLKTVDEIGLIRNGEEIIMTISARSFMHNQVRSMIGSLKLVGDGKWTLDELAAALEAKDRKRCGTVAPAGGLFLHKIEY